MFNVVSIDVLPEDKHADKRIFRNNAFLNIINDLLCFNGYVFSILISVNLFFFFSPEALNSPVTNVAVDIMAMAFLNLNSCGTASTQGYRVAEYYTLDVRGML